MRHLMRWAFNGAAAVSATMFVMTCVLWVRSYSANLDVSLAQTGGASPSTWLKSGIVVGATDGEVLAEKAWIASDAAPISQYKWKLGFNKEKLQPFGADRFLVPLDMWGHLGFHYVHITMVGVADYRLVHIPLWSAAILMTLLPLARIMLYRRMRKFRSAGLCPSCGYDLRATPTQCPECGAVPSVKAAT